jgi:hypothetical protein
MSGVAVVPEAARRVEVLLVLVGLLLSACATSAAPTESATTPTYTPTPAGSTSPEPSITVGPSGSDAAVGLLAVRTFRSHDGSTSHMVLVQPDGTLLEVPAEIAQLSGLRWSPDGTRLLGHVVTGEGPTPIVVTLATGQITRLGAGILEIHGSGWSPDGTEVLLTPGWFSQEIVLARADGSALHTLADGVQQTFWSPDGRSIAITEETPGGRRLAILDPSTGARTTIADDVNGVVAWLPDGSGIVVSSDASCRFCLLVLSAGELRPLDEPLSIWNGRELAFLGWRGEHELVIASASEPRPFVVEVALLDIRTGTITSRLEVDGTVPSKLFLSPDGSTIAYERFDQQSYAVSIWLQPIDGSSPEALTVPAPGIVDTILAWQPAAVPVPWRPFVAPTPAPVPIARSGTARLTVTGARTGSAELAGTCTTEPQRVVIELTSGTAGAQLGISGGGTVLFLSVSLDGFMAMGGKGWEVAPPFVVAAPESMPAGGSLTFDGLTDAMDEPGTIGGTLTWSCPGS